MPNRCATPTACLKNARGKALEAVAEIEEMIRMNADAGVMDLRVDWAVGELMHAVTELRMAHQKAHEPIRDESGERVVYRGDATEPRRAA